MASMVFLGLSIILFLTIFGVMFLISASIIGAVYTAFDEAALSFDLGSEWYGLYLTIRQNVIYLLPLMMSLGVFVLVIKVLMAAGVIGRD